MARKLNAEEKLAFEAMVQVSERTGLAVGPSGLSGLAERSQTAMTLTPELAAWFALEFPLRDPDT